MELIIIIVAIIASVIIYFNMSMNKKELEKLALDKELNTISEKIPENIEICKNILKKLGNNTTKIEENKDSEATLYIAISDKISIGNTHKSFTRIQTMSHECLHSVQDRKMLIFNFIYYVVRVFLENDAMIKAQYVAREYLEEQKDITKEEIEKLFNGFENLNKGCIKGTNCSLFIGIMIKLVLFNALALIF